MVELSESVLLKRTRRCEESKQGMMRWKRKGGKFGLDMMMALVLGTYLFLCAPPARAVWSGDGFVGLGPLLQRYDWGMGLLKCITR
jgi:hypothetical protein